jgi:hypothetical protein
LMLGLLVPQFVAQGAGDAFRPRAETVWHTARHVQGQPSEEELRGKESACSDRA